MVALHAGSFCGRELCDSGLPVGQIADGADNARHIIRLKTNSASDGEHPAHDEQDRAHTNLDVPAEEECDDPY